MPIHKHISSSNPFSRCCGPVGAKVSSSIFLTGWALSSERTAWAPFFLASLQLACTFVLAAALKRASNWTNGLLTSSSQAFQVTLLLESRVKRACFPRARSLKIFSFLFFLLATRMKSKVSVPSSTTSLKRDIWLGVHGGRMDVAIRNQYRLYLESSTKGLSWLMAVQCSTCMLSLCGKLRKGLGSGLPSLELSQMQVCNSKTREKKGGFNKAHLPCALHPLTTSLYDTKPAL